MGWAQQPSAGLNEIWVVGSCKGERKPYSTKEGIFQTCIDFRYDVNGFVEDLPQLPEARVFHVCTSLPATGVSFNDTMINNMKGRVIKISVPDPSPIILATHVTHSLTH